MLEKEVQTELLLELNKYPNLRFWRQNTGVAVGLSQLHAVKRAIETRKYKYALGLIRTMVATKYGTKGQSDTQGIALPSGIHIWFEVKATGKLKDESDAQIKWGEMITKYGGHYACVDSLALAEWYLKQWGLI